MPGDRKSDCGARMQPIGLTLKNIKVNPYTQKTSGEIMLVHLCVSCAQISCNRIAGDDNAYSIVCLLEKIQTIDDHILDKLLVMSIRLLTSADIEMVSRALMGSQYTSLMGE